MFFHLKLKCKANFKGVGTINGAGNYGFLVSAIDGDISGGGGVDKFRIKIWNLGNGAVVYDNNRANTEENADPATAIGGGAVIIHDKQAKSGINPANEETISAGRLVVTAYPNPAPRYFTLRVQSPGVEAVSIRVINAAGAVVETKAGIAGNAILQLGAKYRPGIYYIEVLQGREKVMLKAVKLTD